MCADKSDHFGGKKVLEHLKDARKRGMMATAEPHGTELAGPIHAGVDAAKETAIALLLLGLICYHVALPSPVLYLLFFSTAWVLWKAGRSAMIGWARLERLHRLIEEERWEIEHRRDQEKEELIEMYKAKGFRGTLLDQVIHVLMADDNRLLQIMLEEEMGLTLEAFEHPLQQSLGAAIGAGGAALTIIASTHLFYLPGLLVSTGGVITSAAVLGAHRERNRILPTLIWTFSLTCFAAGILEGIFRWLHRQ